MASKQDSPTRKKQKIRATRKLALWRVKKALETAGSSEADKK